MSPLFQDVSANLAPTPAKDVDDWLNDWAAHPSEEWHQLAWNIREEAAMDPAVFRDFLATAAGHWRAGTLTKTQYKSICENWPLNGPKLPAKPSWVGRVERLPSFLRGRQAVQPGVSQADFVKEITTSAHRPGTGTPQSHSDILPRIYVEALPLSPVKYITFVTFTDDRYSQPFHDHLCQRDIALDQLGLGKITDLDWLVIVIYEPSSSNLNVHVPTVCDAGDYHYFRPAPYATGLPPVCGYACSLTGLPPSGTARPEAVHEACGWQFIRLL